MNFTIKVVLIVFLIITHQPVGLSQDDVRNPVISKNIWDSILVYKRFDILKDSAVISPLPVVPPQVTPTVHLKKDKDIIHIGGIVTFKAELSRPDKEAVYIFTIDNKEILSAGSDISSVRHRFADPGIFNIRVLVRTRNLLLQDSLRVEVNESPEVDTIPGIREYNVTLDVRNPQSMVGDEVFFTALSNINFEGLEYWFNFGDDTVNYRSASPSVQHIYRKPDYYKASVRLAINNRILSSPTTAIVIIEQPLQPSVMLEIFNYAAFINDTITFIASSNIEDGLTYEFFLGEDFNPIRTDRNIIQFVYPVEGTYEVFVKLYQKGREIAESETQEVVIKSSLAPTSASEPDWWIFVIVILIIGSAGYIVRKNIIKPELTFHPYPDQGLQTIKEQEKFAINYEIHFNPNLEDSDYQLNTKNEDFIHSKMIK